MIIMQNHTRKNLPPNKRKTQAKDINKLNKLKQRFSELKQLGHVEEARIIKRRILKETLLQLSRKRDRTPKANERKQLDLDIRLLKEKMKKL
jgi:hypothetical protein